MFISRYAHAFTPCQAQTRHPEARRLDIKAFVNRPIPRLLRYELLLKAVLDETPADHEDRVNIPQILEVIKDLGKATEPGVTTSKQKVELWKYNSNLVFKPGEAVVSPTCSSDFRNIVADDGQDMDLLGETRTLIHTGKLLRQPDTGFEWSGWSELFILLFDNYCERFLESTLTPNPLFFSGDDETQREGWYHQIPSQSQGMFAILVG